MARRVFPEELSDACRGCSVASLQPDLLPCHVPHEAALALAGVHGIASELVRHAPELGAVVAALLGRTLVVDDLPTARACLPHLPSGWSAVTLGGEIARSGGSVTGGSAVRESGILSRERELRELPRTIARLSKERDGAVATLRAADEAPRRIAEERQRIEGERAAVLAARKERQAQRSRLQTWLSELRAEGEAATRQLQALADATDTAERERAAIETDIAALTAEVEALRQEHAQVLAGLQRDSDAIAANEQALAEEQRRLAALEERLRGERRRETSLQAQRQNLEEERSVRAERTSALEREIAAVADLLSRLGNEREQLVQVSDRLQIEGVEIEARVQEAEAEVSQLEQALEQARTALLEAERGHAASSLAAERARGDLAALRQRIRDDLDVTEPETLLVEQHGSNEGAENGSWQEDAVEREIVRLKDRLRKVGYVGEDAVAEYEREAERHAFLRAQLADVQGAAASLRQLLEELRATMQRRFDETFAKVAAAFSESFTTLFGGGTARLMLVPGEDGTGAGVDIVAQPPGKRLQSLALLSGGERALTAVALLFAILRVNPAPFCLLDEVDAALDEANIVRFREQLQALAEQTQVIIITHNRGTIEAATTLYGVSMRDDGVSQVLSLRLAEAERVTP